jgi:hypothetical protein
MQTNIKLTDKIITIAVFLLIQATSFCFDVYTLTQSGIFS